MKVYVIKSFNDDNQKYEAYDFYDTDEAVTFKKDNELNYRIGDFVYKAENGEWLLVDAYPYISAETNINKILKMPEEEKIAHQKDYDFSLYIMKEYFRDPNLFDRKLSLRFLEIRNNLEKGIA